LEADMSCPRVGDWCIWRGKTVQVVAILPRGYVRIRLADRRGTAEVVAWSLEERVADEREEQGA
jgi:hypothetical protein